MLLDKNYNSVFGLVIYRNYRWSFRHTVPHFINMDFDTLRSSLLGRVALGTQRPIVVKLSRGRSVGRSVCRSVCLSSALWKNGESDPAAVWRHRSDGSRDEAGSRVWGSVHGKGYFGGEFGARHCNQWGLRRTCPTAPRRGPLPKLLWADLLQLADQSASLLLS